MRKEVIFTVVLFCVNVLAGCDTVMCGEEGGAWNDLIEQSRKKVPSFLVIDPIPCESYYLNVLWKGNNPIDTMLIREAHNALYDKVNKRGWRVLDVYNSSNDYLFSLSLSGNTFIRGERDK